QVLKDAGFDVMSIANNHTGDFGPKGRKDTIAALDKVGILHSGPVGDLATWEVKGRKIALAAFSFGADVYRIQEIDIGKRLVAKLAAENDIVIVSFHAGAEGKGADNVPKGVEKFLGENRGDSRAFAHAMIDAGADLLLGHGPHVLRAMEVYKGRLIAYSLGNFSAWENFALRGPGGITGVLEVELAPNGVLRWAQLHPGIIEDPGRPKPDPEKQAITRVRRLSKEDFGTELLDEDGRYVYAP
ncbi:MAG: CapA family protein, partial [Myxococcales bacterium]